MPAALDALVGHVCGLGHLRQDTGINYRSAGTDLQAVQLADLMAGGGWKAQLLGQTGDHILPVRVVHSKGFTSYDHATPLLRSSSMTWLIFACVNSFGSVFKNYGPYGALCSR